MIATSAKRSSRKLVRFFRWASFFFLVVGFLCLGYAGYYVVAERAFQSIEMRKFEHSVPLAEPHLPINGQVLGRIRVPRLNLQAILVEGDSRDVLDKAVGHIPGTAMPGEWGNVALAGHRDRLFRPLRGIRVGDSIAIELSSGSFDYEVVSTFVVASSTTEVLRPTNQRELTLITCFPFNYVGAAPNRFIVRAREVAHKAR
jgi:sortase A